MQSEKYVRVEYHQDIITEWLPWRLATGEVPGSNPGKGENYKF